LVRFIHKELPVDKVHQMEASPESGRRFQMSFEVKEITYGTKEYDQELELRNEVLRKPLGMDLYKQDLTVEKDFIRIGGFWDNSLVGILLLVPKNDKIIQMKQMAVKDSFRGQNIGREIINYGENLAKRKGYTQVVLSARKVALDFYLKSGYEIQGEEFEEVGIPHYKMMRLL